MQSAIVMIGEGNASTNEFVSNVNNHIDEEQPEYNSLAKKFDSLNSTNVLSRRVQSLLETVLFYKTRLSSLSMKKLKWILPLDVHPSLKSMHIHRNCDVLKIIRR